MIVLQPVLEIQAIGEGFDLWPVAEAEPYGFLPLSGALSPAEVGTAVMSIAACNDHEPDDGRPPRPTDPLGAFLHGLLTMDDLFASGGLRVTDTVGGRTLVPGCCNGIDERSDWAEVVDGSGWASFGHAPSPCAERLGERVRLTVDGDREHSPVFELTVTELRGLLSRAERDLADFVHLVGPWAARHVPGRAEATTAAVARALAVPAPVQ
ncbi:hypothetical protein [Streptomyces erythrochromogenes]|uniref:hypothetical protein n=1 Tax=Streptomyces erythrochromogenes TaxID=285574 RepID=UPI00386E7175|nr:hypothetical protein OG364_38560 [Streptomyces erythrochromogenes]